MNKKKRQRKHLETLRRAGLAPGELSQEQHAHFTAELNRGLRPFMQICGLLGAMGQAVNAGPPPATPQPKPRPMINVTPPK